jgi:iron complex outermembrane receptor protein
VTRRVQKNRNYSSVLAMTTVIGFGLFGGTAIAQTVPAGEAVADQGAAENVIIVTANKRSQSINDVGMSITAVAGDDLAVRGVSSVDDLAKLVPGFTFQPSPYATPVYTIRGVGLYDNGLASSPAVTTYVDEIPVPFPAMTTGITLDLERVEVLKGPQGTLFGQNSTGGAINYIAAKPTDNFSAGGSISYDNFSLVDFNGYVSGPLSDTLKARVAFRAVTGGAWQKSLTRPNDELGSSEQFVGRILVDWEPSDNLRFNLNVNGFTDNSDIQAAQYSEGLLNVTAAGDPNNPYAIIDPVRFASINDPTSPNYDATFLGRQALMVARLNGMSGYPEPFNSELQQITDLAMRGPIAPDDARAADWNPAWPNKHNKDYYQVALRAAYDLNDDITLTSITSFQKLTSDAYLELDASAAFALENRSFGSVKNFSQELRISGETGRLNWLIGGNYDSVKHDESANPFFTGLSLNEPAPGLIFTQTLANLKQNIKTYSIFANAEFEIVDNLTVQAGVRYTDSNNSAQMCTSDPTAAQNVSTFFTILQSILAGAGAKTTPVVPIGPGDCYQLTLAPDLSPVVTPELRTLDEENTSWRFGVNYKLGGGGLVYANASRGFKAGIFSPIAGSSVSASEPAVQERVDAFEAGVKLPLMDQDVQLNAAVFHYKYRDKQIRAKELDPIFGSLEKLINVPRSKVTGAEVELVVRPVDGLHLSASGSYLDSEITSTTGNFFNQQAYRGAFTGSDLPYTPKFTGVLDAQYDWSLGDTLAAFVGSSVNIQGKSYATPGNAILKNDEFVIPSYALLDLRAGLGAADGSWRVSIFGRNVTDKYYITTSFASGDVRYRYAGRPATYGATVSFKY